MKKTSIIILFAVLLFFVNSLLYSQCSASGRRIDLTSKLNLDKNKGQFAQVFIPDFFSASDTEGYMLIIHLHGASWVVENEIYKSKTNGILFNIHLGGFSSSYKNYFVDEDKFQAILDLVKKTIIHDSIIVKPVLENLIVTSFSAGYGGVREILKNNAYYDIINAIILADGLHSDLAKVEMEIQIKDFLRFAKDARDNRKIMFLTHSSILTHSYANTTETADYLIENIGAKRISKNRKDTVGTQYSFADTGKFHVKGYRGNTAEDHMKHFYNMNIMLRQASDYLTDKKTN
jgi:hypothetical protein